MSHRTSQRISMSLSEDAFSVIESDMEVFMNARNLDGFINRVIHNYKDISDASISLAEQRERDKYINWLKSINDNSKVSEQELKTIDKLVSAYTNDLTVRMNAYPNGIQLKPRINNENYDDLEMGSSDFLEEMYYQREGRYIKALMEEYAALPFFEREGIYFKDTIETINHAIDAGNVIKIKYINRKQDHTALTIRPYKIVSSSLLRYHYLIALPSNRGEKQDILSLRLSRIEGIRILSRTSHITTKEKACINEKIRNNGIQFIVSNDSEIIVRLTADGYKLFKSILYLRPRPISITPCGDYRDLTFICAEEQIKNYFFQFGKEALIQQPEALRSWFFTRYSEASQKYSE